MLVFIDESGDSGFKLTGGSSQNFVMAMVIFSSGPAAAQAQEVIKTASVTEKVKPEWKFAKTSDAKREAFFKAIHDCDFQCRSIVVQKHLIHSHNLRTKPAKFNNFFTRMMCEHDGGLLKDAKIVLDGSGDRRYKKEFSAYLRRELPQGAMKSFTMKDSSKDNLVQLADMCAGAIARSYSGKPKGDKWLKMLHKSGKISNVWEFK
jgi:hypothetical protein